jgi:hypothetical protein
VFINCLAVKHGLANAFFFFFFFWGFKEGKKMYAELLESEGLKRDDSVKPTSRKSKKSKYWAILFV